MKTVYKYNVPRAVTILHIPQGFKVLEYECQNNINCIWCEVETTNELEEVTFCDVGTGQQIPDNSEHVGTLQDGPFVWHLYQIKE